MGKTRGGVCVTGQEDGGSIVTRVGPERGDTGSICLLALVAVLMSALAATPVQATTLTFDYNFEFSGATAPSGPAPWLKATFDDFDSSGTVQLSIAASGLTGSEFIPAVYFNVDPAIIIFDLFKGFGLVDTSDVGSVIAFFGTDSFKADGDGLYDLLFSFPTSGNRFTSGEEVAFEFNLAGLTANSFDFLSTPDGGAGTFLSAAKIQGIGPNDDSGWVAPVPMPGTLTLLVSGLLLLAGWRGLRALESQRAAATNSGALPRGTALRRE